MNLELQLRQIKKNIKDKVFMVIDKSEFIHPLCRNKVKQEIRKEFASLQNKEQEKLKWNQKMN